MAKKKTKKKTKQAAQEQNLSKEIIGITLIAIGLFCAYCFYISPSGQLGMMIKDGVKAAFGLVSYVMPVLLVVLGVIFIAARDRVVNAKKVIPAILFTVSVFCIIHLAFYNRIAEDTETYGEFLRSSVHYGMQDVGGGVLPGLLVHPCMTWLGAVGAWILFVAVLLGSVLILTNLSIKKVSKDIGGRVSHAVQHLKREPEELYDEALLDDEDIDQGEPVLFDEQIQEGQGSMDFDRLEEEPPTPVKRTRTRKAKPVAAEDEVIPEAEEEDSYYESGLSNREGYVFPPLTLLSLPKGRKSGTDNYKEKADKLIATLKSFGIPAEIINISRGPAITRFELSVASGIKVSRILALSDDIALSMATTGVRIEAPIPGKSAIGIEVPNQDTTMVSLRELLDTKGFQEHLSPTCFGLGKDIAGNTVLADLHRMPHLLIAGTTGSGKSVCINSMIVSLLYKSSPEDVRMIMIDPKVVELSVYNGIPHLLMPVVTDPKKAAGALNAMLREMENRYRLFAEADVRDIGRYNEVQRANGEKALPRIVIIIDELADLMMVAPDDVENSICRLAQLARAAGMYLVIATQRPSVNVITGVIKANLPSRIAFAVSSVHDSRTILDAGGAEKLLGKGDMLYHPNGELKPFRVQGAFLSDTEVRDVVSFVKRDREPDYNEELMKTQVDEDKDSPLGEDVDALFSQALRIVIESEQASISLLQRRMRIGYSRAGRLIDEMTERGFISGSEGSKPRQVLITREQYANLFKQEEPIIGG